MVNAQNLLYSASSARRILGIYYPEIRVQIQIWRSTVWVWVEGRRPTFISKSAFKQHFIDWRKSQTKNLTVTQDKYLRRTFNVCNEVKQTIYEVVTADDGIHCTCEDYQNQVRYLGKGCCKHGYATLNYLGFKSLADYLPTRELIAA